MRHYLRFHQHHSCHSPLQKMRHLLRQQTLNYQGRLLNFLHRCLARDLRKECFLHLLSQMCHLTKICLHLPQTLPLGHLKRHHLLCFFLLPRPLQRKLLY